MSQVPASPHLDVRNILWLIAAMAFVVAPHLLRLPYWVGVFFLVILAWRAWSAWAAMHLPSRWITAALTIAAAAPPIARFSAVASAAWGFVTPEAPNAAPPYVRIRRPSRASRSRSRRTVAGPISRCWAISETEARPRSRSRPSMRSSRPGTTVTFQVWPRND